MSHVHPFHVKWKTVSRSEHLNQVVLRLAAGIQHLEGHTLEVRVLHFYMQQQQQNIQHPGYTGTPNTFKSLTITVLL